MDQDRLSYVIYSCLVAAAVELLIPVNYTKWIINYSHTALHYNGTVGFALNRMQIQWIKSNKSLEHELRSV